MALDKFNCINIPGHDKEYKLYNGESATKMKHQEVILLYSVILLLYSYNHEKRLSGYINYLTPLPPNSSELRMKRWY